MKNLAGNANAVKAIFDHVRNTGIAAAVLGAARWTYGRPTSTDMLYPIWAASVFALAIIGAFLFVLNEMHAYRRLNEAGIPFVAGLAISITWGLCVFHLLAAVAVR